MQLPKKGTVVNKILNHALGGKMVLYSYTPQTHPYTDFLEDFIKAVGKIDKRVIYITSNRPSSFLTDMIQAKGGKLENIFLIDAISGIIGESGSTKNIVYTSGPSDLTSLSISFTYLGNKFKNCIAIIDSISAFLTYNDSMAIMRFLDHIITYSRKMKFGLVIISTKKDLSDKYLGTLEQKVDSITECC